MASIGLKVVRAAFSASEVVAPSLAGRVAFTLFCRTANPSSLTAGERRAVAGASDLMATARHHRINIGQSCVAVHEFRPDNDGASAGRVLVAHGWRSRTEFMRAPIEGLLAAGYRVYALDFPGHGASSGRRLDLKLGVEAIKAASDWFGPFVAMVGHSFGGAVAVSAACGSVKGIAPVPTGRIVTIASPSVIGDIFTGFGDVVGLGPRTQAAMNAQVEPIAGRPLADYRSDKLLARLPIETLVIHAHDDREVGPYHADLVGKAGSHVTVEWHDGLGHRRILGDAAVVDSVVRFIRAPQTDRLAA